jgi:MFS family permease
MKVRQNIVLIVVSLGIFFEALDIAIVNLAMPMIQAHFHLTSDTVQWMQTLYVLFYGGFLIVGGKLADLVGRKKIFMAGSLIFLITSFGAGVATSFEMLAAFRAFQGLGAALVMPSALSIITNTFTEQSARNKAIGIFGSFAAIGSGSGLSLGGLIATYLGWQWVFFINVPVILVSLALGYFYILPDERVDLKTKPDLLSGILITSVILALTYVIHDLKHIAANFWIITLLTFFVVLFTWIFARRIRRVPDPLIDFSLLRSPATRTGNGVIVLMGAFFTGYLFILSLLMQLNMGFTAADAGLILLPFSIFSAVVSKFFVPRMLKRISIGLLGIVGMSLMTTGAVALIGAIVMNYNLAILTISIACVTGAGIAVCFNSLMVIAMQDIPPEHHGLASGIANTSYFFGAGLGLSVLGLFMQLQTQPLNRMVPALVLCTFAGAGLTWIVVAYQRRLKIQTT